MNNRSIIIVTLCALLIFFVRVTHAYAQVPQFSDSLRVSLLTCSMGPDAYERFGHTGIRLQDQKNPELDITFHYGVFNFNTPDFIYRFVKGETDYELGATLTKNFVEGYRRRGLGMTEAWLRLDKQQTLDLAELLIENYRPENRTYRYSFFFDNCATRPYNRINEATQNQIRYDSTWVNSITLREMVRKKSGRNNWLDFGISLAVALRADKQTSYQEQMFLPEYLERALRHAEIPTKVGENTWYQPIIEKRDTLLTMTPEVKARIEAEEAVPPMLVLGILAVIALLLSIPHLIRLNTWKSLSQGKGFNLCCNLFDSLLMIVTCITGSILWFLNFFSEHPAVDNNLNCLWLLPTDILLAVMLWIPSCKKYCFWYAAFRVTLLIVYFMCDWTWEQFCPAMFIISIGIILFRMLSRIRQLEDHK